MVFVRLWATNFALPTGTSGEGGALSPIRLSSFARPALVRILPGAPKRPVYAGLLFCSNGRGGRSGCQLGCQRAGLQWTILEVLSLAAPVGSSCKARGRPPVRVGGPGASGDPKRGTTYSTLFTYCPYQSPGNGSPGLGS